MPFRTQTRIRWAKWTVLLLALCTSLPAGADVLKRDKDLQPFAESVMQSVSRGDLTAAYAAIAQYSSLPAAEVDQSRQASIAQRGDAFVARYGKTQGYEFLAQKKLGAALVHLVYLESAERHPLIWNFYFYRSPQGWVLSGFGWDDQAAAFIRQ